MSLMAERKRRCGPCRIISPVFEAHSQSGKYGAVEFYKLDVDGVPDASEEAGIRAMPTFMVFKDGQKIDELVGASPERLETLLSKANSLA
ncbi:hypothetical protein FRC01_004838 [Tulasnella sp. 417]|nr:hypothetical protein FRC01_004838 [Tulasnella sp. 417]